MPSVSATASVLWGGVVLLNDAPLPFGKEKIEVHGKANVGYDTNARGVSGSASLEAGYGKWGLRLHGMYTKGGDYSTADYILNNTGYNTISLSGALGYHASRVTATVYSSLYYQRSGIYYASKISDLDQLVKRFEYGRPDSSTFRPFSYDIKPPFQQSQHFTLKGEVKWNLSDNHRIDFTASFQETSDRSSRIVRRPTGAGYRCRTSSSRLSRRTCSGTPSGTAGG